MSIKRKFKTSPLFKSSFIRGFFFPFISVNFLVGSTQYNPFYSLYVLLFDYKSSEIIWFKYASLCTVIDDSAYSLAISLLGISLEEFVVSINWFQISVSVGFINADQAQIQILKKKHDTVILISSLISGGKKYSEIPLLPSYVLLVLRDTL